MPANTPYRRIVVALDAQGRASEAFLRGYQLAQSTGAEFELVHAVDPPASLWPALRPADMEPLREAAKQAARQQVLTKLDSAAKRAGIQADLDPQLEILLGRPELALIDHVRATAPDLLILGPHSRESMLDFGHTVRSVLAHVDIPVWIEPGTSSPVRRILVPTDLSEHSRHALDHAVLLAAALGAEVRLLHAYAPPIFAYGDASTMVSGPTYTVERDREITHQEFERWIDEYSWGDVAHTFEFVDGDAVKSILASAETCDLIVMGTHGRTGFSRFLVGSVAQGIAKRSTKPVVAVPKADRVWQAPSAAGAGPADAKPPVPSGV